MSVWKRRIAAGGVGVLLLAALLATASLAWLHARFDANRYQGVAIDWVRAHYQRTLTIDGPVELSVFPRIAVSVGKLALSESGHGPEFAALEHARLGIQMLPLLQGRVVIGSVQARGLRVQYRRDAQGRSNVEDFLDADKLPADTSDGRDRVLHLDVSRIELADVQARVRDELTGVAGELTLARLTTGRLGEQTEAPLSFNARFALTAPAATGELNGDATLQMDLAARRFALQQLNLALKADAPAVSAIDASLHGTLAWSGARRTLDASALELRLSANTNSVRLVGSSIAIEHAVIEPAARAWTVRQLRARLRGSQAGQPMSLDVDWPALAVRAHRLEGSPVSGSLKLDGAAPLALRFSTAAPEGRLDALRLPGFEARIAGSRSTAPTRKLEGSLRADLLLRPDQPSLALDGLQMKATLHEDGLPPLAIGLHGRVLASTQQSSWVLGGELDADRFELQGLLTLTGPTPVLKASAHFDAIDLNRFLSHSMSRPADASARSEPDDQNDAPVDLSPLRALDAELTLRAGRLAWRQFRAEELRLAGQLQGGMLRLNEMKGRAWGGEIDATAFADARASRIALRGVAQGIELQRMLKDLGGRDLLRGRGRVALDLDTAGRSASELKARLAGTASLQLRDGSLQGVDLAKLLRASRPATAAQADAVHRAMAGAATGFGELTAGWRIVDGVARSEDIDLKAPSLRMTGDGTLTLASGTLDLIARTVLSAALPTDAAATPAARGLTVPVRLTGTLEAPLWSVLWSQVGGTGGDVRDRIKERLKGLLR